MEYLKIEIEYETLNKSEWVALHFGNVVQHGFLKI
jgi:hypothetical protein